MDMEGHAYSDHLAELVAEGLVDEAVIDELVRNVLRLKMRLGLFENPYVDMATANSFYAPESLDAARRAVEESSVLLTNNGVLPLKAAGKILVTGPMADAAHDQNGTWCFDLDKSATITPLTSLREMYGDRIVYVPGLTYSRDMSHDGFAAATAAAREADVILYFAGEEAVLSGEAHCRADITLPGAQKEYLAELAATAKPVVTVIMTGRPMAITDVVKNSAAVLYNFHPGTMGGPAIANVLAGKAVPGGKLPVSLPTMSGQEPMHYMQKNTGRPFEGWTRIEEIPLEAGQTSTGCTTFFLDAGHDALFPFGYGLSYTTFEYGTPRLSADSMTPAGSITVSCDITNTGSVAASDVAQLYVHDRVASLVQPLKMLKGFEKITLAPGETRTVTFTLDADNLGFHDNEANYIVEPGEFTLWVDSSSACATTPATFNIISDLTASK